MTQTINNEDLALDCNGPFVILGVIFLWFESSLRNIDVCLSTIEAFKRYIFSTSGM
jgi:hypothetical protein